MKAIRFFLRPFIGWGRTAWGACERSDHVQQSGLIGLNAPGLGMGAASEEEGVPKWPMSIDIVCLNPASGALEKRILQDDHFCVLELHVYRKVAETAAQPTQEIVLIPIQTSFIQNMVRAFTEFEENLSWQTPDWMSRSAIGNAQAEMDAMDKKIDEQLEDAKRKVSNGK